MLFGDPALSIPRPQGTERSQGATSRRYSCPGRMRLTVALGKRTPTVLKSRLPKVERGIGRILVDQGGARE